MKISVVIPVHNEHESIVPLAGEIEAVFNNAGNAWECLWVDDGSTDDTLNMLEQVHARDARHELIVLSRHCGQSAALLAGLDQARGEILCTMDGDGQCDPRDLPILMAPLIDNRADFVIGIRAIRQDTTARRIMAWLGKKLLSMATGVALMDGGCPIRVFRCECVRGLPRFRGLHRFLPGLAVLNGHRILEIPVHHRPRSHGMSNYGWWNRIGPMACDTLGVIWLRKRGAIYWIRPK